jgi:diguanylate cyclase (GGDEF)-like protein
VWAAVAALCVAAGAAGSVLGAHALVGHDEAQARQNFHLSVTSTGIASAVKVALQREEDLLVAANTFFAGSPKASPAELSSWARGTDALRRYPELQRLGFVALLKTEPALAITTTSAARGLGQLTPTSSSRIRGLRPVAATKPSYYCSAVAQISRSSAGGSAAGGGHCSLSHGLLSARDSGITTFSAHAGDEALGIVAPVYTGGVVPSSVGARRASFVGWLRATLLPSVVLQHALQGHPQAAAQLSYRAGAANATFAAGAPSPNAQSVATDLPRGWTLTSFGPAAGTSVFSDGGALALLIGGVLLSVLAGLLVFLLGARRTPAPIAAPDAAPAPPQEELYDPLTGLPNRALMLDRAQRMLARASRQSGLLIGALFIDIDWFKDVSEKIGPAAGEQLLKIVTERLEAVIRAQDSVGRLGGDEFVVLVESAARGARLESLARRVIEALHKPVLLESFGPSFVVTASIGVAFGRYDTADDLLRDAHLAMLSAKAAGKDRYTLFNANMRSVTESRAVLEAELNAALQGRQLFLLYDPVYDLGTGRVAGLSALIRWQHPKRGVLDPEDFIPLAEETGLIVPLGRWALEEACNRGAAWTVAGHRIGISVSVSPNQLNRDGFETDVRRALQQSGIEPSLLTLEIAETTVIRDVDSAAERLEEIKRLGVRIAIDDFGDGYAHHADLKRLPLDFLTVDRGSLAASDDDDYRSWLLQAIVVMGRDLSLTVIAKGVETDEQMAALRQMGYTMVQGPLVGEPVTAQGVESLFDAELAAASAVSTRFLR